MAVLDLDGDSKLDLLLAGATQGAKNTAARLINLGTGYFSAQEINLSMSANDARLADVNGDSQPDLILLGAQPSILPASSDLVAVMRNEGTSFRALNDFSDGIPSGDISGMVNANLGDGPKVVVADANHNQVQLWSPTSDGRLSLSSSVGLDISPVVISAVDLDGDTYIDAIVTANRKCMDVMGSSSCTGSVTVLQKQNSGGFKSPQTYDLGKDVYPVGLSALPTALGRSWRFLPSKPPSPCSIGRLPQARSHAKTR